MGKMEKVATLDPARVALAEAIANHKEWTRALDTATTAVDRAHTLIDAALLRHEISRADLAAWRANQVSRLHAAATTGEESPQESGRAVRAAVEDSADEIESAYSAATLLWRLFPGSSSRVQAGD